jgi:hypothetical protein
LLFCLQSTYPDRFEPLVHGDFQYYLHRLAHNEEMPEGQPEMFAISEIYCRPVHLFSVNERTPKIGISIKLYFCFTPFSASNLTRSECL